jgi:integrase/recombinase XerD
MMLMTRIKEHLKNYSDYLRIQNYAKSTQKSYQLWLRQFLEFRAVQQISEPLNQEQARLFILYKLDHGVAWATINCLYSSLRKYYKEVLNLEWYVKKIPRPRRDKKLPQLISKQEVIRLIEHLPLYKHQVFVTLLYATGIRLHEGLQLKIGDVDGDRKQIFIRHGKGGKDRYVYLPDCVHLMLRSYYKRIKPTTYLFNGRIKGEQMSPSAVQRAIQQGRKKARILKHATTHTLRHCYATHHLESGTNLVFLQRQMGHKHLKTTAKYIRLSQNYHRTVQHPISSMEIKYYKKNRR